MKLRANKKLTITTDIPEKIHDYPIVPMLLLPLVENAFKHGTCAIEKCFVTITISVENGLLHLHVANSIPKKNDVVSTKIGLKNTIERFEYTKKYYKFIPLQKPKYTLYKKETHQWILH